MALSGLTAFTPIPERSDATPGLWNSRFQQTQDNIVSLYSSVQSSIISIGGLSSNTIQPESGSTVRILNGRELVGNSILSTIAVVDVRAFGAVGDGATDDTTAIQNALNQGSGREVWLGSQVGGGRVYEISSELSIGAHTRLVGIGAPLLRWSGSTDSTKALIRLTATNGAARNYIELYNVQLNGNDRAGYCLILESGDTVTVGRSVSNFRATHCVFGSATSCNVLIGSAATGFPPGADPDASNIVLDQCQFYNAPNNLCLNAPNLFTTEFRRCVFGENGTYAVSGTVEQHVRIGYAGSVQFNGCEFTKMAKAQSGIVGYCVYTQSGDIAIRDCYMEETRLLYSDLSLGQANSKKILVHNIETNSVDTTAERTYAIYNADAHLSVRDASLVGSSANAIRYLYSSSSYLNCQNVDMGGGGGAILVPPAALPYATVDGQQCGGVDNLTRNWNFSDWLFAAAATSDDTLFEWGKKAGSGASFLLKLSSLYTQIGPFTSDISCQVGGSGYPTGVQQFVPIRGLNYATAVMFGRSSSTTLTTPGIVVNDANVTPLVTTWVAISGDTNYFVSHGPIPESVLRNSSGSLEIRAGIAASESGEMWLSGLCLVPGRYARGAAAVMYVARPDATYPRQFTSSRTPNTGTFNIGDKIWNSAPGATNAMGWACILSNTTGGSWATMSYHTT